MKYWILVLKKSMIPSILRETSDLSLLSDQVLPQPLSLEELKALSAGSLLQTEEKKYNYPPSVFISSPISGTTATGISTLRDDIVNCDGTEIGSVVQGVMMIDPGAGYTANPGIAFVGVNTNPGVGAAATTRISDNTVGIVTVTSGGGGRCDCSYCYV